MRSVERASFYDADAETMCLCSSSRTQPCTPPLVESHPRASCSRVLPAQVICLQVTFNVRPQRMSSDLQSPAIAPGIARQAASAMSEEALY